MFLILKFQRSEVRKHTDRGGRAGEDKRLRFRGGQLQRHGPAEDALRKLRVRRPRTPQEEEVLRQGSRHVEFVSFCAVECFKVKI